MSNIIIFGIKNNIALNLAYELVNGKSNIIYGVDDLSGADLVNFYAILKKNNFNLVDTNYKEEFNFPADYIINFSVLLDKQEYLSNKAEYVYNSVKKSEKILNFSKLSGSKLFNIYPKFDYNGYYSDYFSYFDFIKMQSRLNIDYSKYNKNYVRNINICEVYGKYTSKDADFTSTVISKAFNNEDIILNNDESVYYTYSSDIVKGIILLLKNYSDKYDIDISSLNLRSKSDIIKLIINFTKSQSRLIVNNQDSISPSYEPDVKYLNDNFEFRCLTSILDGISETISYYKMMYLQ